MPSSLCIIPARGGSKRIPRKNIRDFLGKPIIAYSIEVAVESGLFDEVMVSTDDKEIAEVAEKFGAKVPFYRSKETSDDYATTVDVLEEVLDRYREKGFHFENVCCLYPCAPFITAQKLREAHDLLKSESLDTVFPVVVFSFPIQRALKLEGDRISFVQPEYAIIRSQDLEESYHDAGQFYWMDTKQVFNKRKIITNNTGALIVSELEVQDVDNEVDWQMAELKFKLFKKS